MFWADKIAADLQGNQIVNDSKTPSGRVHVGSVRGVVIHDVIYRSLKHRGTSVKFIYGVDDYDALDTVPHYLDQEKFSPYLGFPLCNVPSPDESAADYARYFMGEFLEVFEYLGVVPEIYYLRDLYRSGQLNSQIDKFLKNADQVRKAYKEVSKADRPENWYPFQVICENCGKIATTEVTDYDGSSVFYTCKPDATDWVQGCGHSGWVSPFDGNGKLPWKVEWVAKWELLGVTLELAGKDHSQKGGSRDVANAICRKVLGQKPPFHSPYEFILVNGTKMSSSKGVGSSAKEIAELLPPELMRFLMLRTQPKSGINFSPNYETIVRLFRDYDTLIEKYKTWQTSQPDPVDCASFPEELIPLSYAQVDGIIRPYQVIDFSTLISLLQIPHLEIREEIAKRCEHPLTEFDRQILEQRIAVAQKWLQDYADEEEKLVLYLDQVPEQARSLSPEQIAYLTHLIDHLENAPSWDGETLQTILFTASKACEIQQPVAFKAVYLSFLGKEHGPRAGALLSYLDKDFVIGRLKAITEN
jgi:lysyl-tRNA synthetase class 1